MTQKNSRSKNGKPGQKWHVGSKVWQHNPRVLYRQAGADPGFLKEGYLQQGPKQLSRWGGPDPCWLGGLESPMSYHQVRGRLMYDDKDEEDVVWEILCVAEEPKTMKKTKSVTNDLPNNLTSNVSLLQLEDHQVLIAQSPCRTLLPECLILSKPTLAHCFEPKKAEVYTQIKQF